MSGVNDFQIDYFAKGSKLEIVVVGRLQILRPQLPLVQVACSTTDNRVNKSFFLLRIFNHFIQWLYKKIIL
jgi:hypothetical protein